MARPTPGKPRGRGPADGAGRGAGRGSGRPESRGEGRGGGRGSGADPARDRALQERLIRLWERLKEDLDPPTLDRWLGHALSGLDGLRRVDRLMLGDLLVDAVRFAALIVFCEEWRRRGGPDGVPLEERLGAWAGAAGPDVWRRLRKVPVPAVFYWTFMRKRSAGAALPAIAPPGPDAPAVWTVVKGALRMSDEPVARCLWAGLPPALVPLVEERAATSGWDDAARLAFLDRHASRPPLWLRWNDRSRRDAVLAELAREGFAVQEQGAALGVSGSRGIYELACYRDGVVSVQDLASQGIGAAVEAAPGDLVWDCCAGAGGKSLQLAAALGGTGAVLATDLYQGKLEDLRRRVRRSGFDTVRSAVWDGERLPDFGRDVADHGGFDRVLVDAPCSGSGTWRRNPDGRLRFAESQIPGLVAVESHLLQLAAGAVRPGGRLVYATCSWFHAENEAVTAAFLAQSPTFALRSQTLLGNPAADSDTTFVAVFERTAAG